MWAFVDDFTDKAFYRRARWSDCGVTIHSGREMKFDLKKPIEFPCREMYLRDNETIGGVQRCIDEQREAEALEDARPELRGDDTENGERGGEAVQDRPSGQEDVAAGDAAADLVDVDIDEPFPEEVEQEIRSLENDIETGELTLIYIPSGISSRG